MARLIALELRPQLFFRCAFAAGLGLMIGAATVRAEPPATNAAPAKPSLPAVAGARPMAPTPLPPLPPGMQNTLARYGNIITPGDQVAYPLRLRLPMPNEGEVHIPKPDDLAKRAKIEALANLSDDDIRKQLAAWPAYSKMSLHDQGAMLQRIQDFRDYHARVALQKARDMGLFTLTPAQQAKFEKEYWDQRLKLDQDLAKQFQPIYQAREQTMDGQLFREFSSAMPAPPAPKPAHPPTPPSPTIAFLTNAAPQAR